jgi:signal transduction histidine kinase
MPETQQSWLVSFLPPRPTHRRVALAVSTFLLAGFVITIPFAEVILPQLSIYIPLVATVMFLNDLTTASLLLVQFSIARSRSLLLLANGYLFTALVVAVFGLVWPGAFHPTGLFGAGPQTVPWLYLIWHAGLPTSVIVYALLKSKEHKKPPVVQGSAGMLIFASGTCNVLIVCGLTWFVTRFQDVLPSLMTPFHRSSEFSHFGTGAILIVSIVALVLQWRRRRRSVLDLWLSVVTLAWLLGSIMLVAIGARYEVAWYAAPGFSVVSAIPVLIVLLSQSLMLNALIDFTERERFRQLESDLAHMTRLSVMGELTASLVHEITQPIAAARNNARAALNFLDKKPLDLDEIREGLHSIVGNADRAGDIIDRIRDHIKKAPPRKCQFDLNEAINEVILLAQSAITTNGVSVRTHLAEALAPIEGDRVQLQQVVLNLILNAVEGMSTVEARPRELSISTEQSEAGGVLVSVRDSGPGIDPDHYDDVFQAFYTTKSSGIGMGLSISRSIIDAHGGRLWADMDASGGAVLRFSLPGATKELTISRRTAT